VQWPTLHERPEPAGGPPDNPLARTRPTLAIYRPKTPRGSDLSPNIFTDGGPVRTSFKPLLSRQVLLALLGGLALFSGGCAARLTGVARGQELWNGCAPCHGADASGNQSLAAPAIAGLPDWYLQRQLANFKAGIRAYHPDDFTGLHMRPMTLMLETPEDVAAVVSYVTTLTAVTPAATVTGDAAKGKVTYALCTACHQADGTGNQLLNSPPVKKLADWYVVAQLEKFKAGVRGTHPQDAFGQQMRAMSMTLADTQAMADVAAYINSL